MSSGELLERLSRALGPKAASALMDRLPPPGTRAATREDVTEQVGALERRIDARFDAVDARFEALEARIGEAKNEILAATRGELIAAVTSQTRTMIATMAGTVASLMAFFVAFERVAG